MPAIEVNSVTKSFKNVRAINNISFRIKKGEFFGLLGANGAGKSTLINIIGGLTIADSGTVKVNGFDVRAQYKNTRKLVGIVPQELVYDPFFTVGEMLRLQSGYFGRGNNREWVDEILFELNLADKRNADIQSLSGGMKRRLLIAQALVHKPSVLILDEPTAGVDVDLRRNLWNFVRKLNAKGTTIVLTTHYLEEAEKLCERIAVLNRGVVISLEQREELLARRRNLCVRLKTDDIPGWIEQYRYEYFDNRLEIMVAKNDELQSLMTKLAESGLSLDSLEIKRPTLEDVFVEMLAEDHV